MVFASLDFVFGSQMDIEMEKNDDKTTGLFVVPTPAGRFCNKLLVCSIYSILSIKHKKSISFSRYGNDYSQSLFNFIDKEKLNLVNEDNGDHSVPSQVSELNCCNDQYLQCSAAANLIVNNSELIFKDEIINEQSIEGIFVHMRLDDLALNFRLDRDYYDLALQQIPNYKQLRKVVTSSDLGNQTLTSFARDFDFEIYEGGKEETLKFGSRFTNKILSHGTYSWFIGALGSNNNIIYPKFYEDKTWHDPSLYEVEGWNCLSYRN